MRYIIVYEIIKNGHVVGEIRGRKTYSTERRAEYASRRMKSKKFLTNCGYEYRTYISQELHA